MTARALTAALVLGALARGAAAHPLEEATARISLRDGQVEVVADLDLLALTGLDATALAIAPEVAVVDAQARARRALEEDGQLRVDGRRIGLRAHGLPEAAELRALAAAASAAGGHGALVRVRLEALAGARDARTIELAMPVAIGPVLTSLVEPTSRYVTAGGMASFRVEPRGGGGGGGSRALGAIALGALALLAGAAGGWALRGRGTVTP